jgi:hypothetical protein
VPVRANCGSEGRVIGGAGETFIDDFIPTNASVLTFGMKHDDGSDDNGRDWSLRSYAICGSA